VNFLRRLALQERKLDDSSRLDVVETARRLTYFFSASVTGKDLHFAHEQTPLSNDTIDSVLQHRELSRTKDLSTPPRMWGSHVRNCNIYLHFSLLQLYIFH